MNPTHGPRLAWLALLLLGCGACGRGPPPAAPGAAGHPAAAGKGSCLWAGATSAPLPLRADDLASQDRHRQAIRAVLTPWVEAHGRWPDPDSSSRAVLRIRLHPQARWHEAELLMHTVAHPELRVWHFTLQLEGERRATDYETPRDPGVTDSGPVVRAPGTVEDVRLGMEYRATCLSVRVVRDAQGRRRTRLLVDERTWMEPPSHPVAFDVPIAAASAPAQLEAWLEGVLQHLQVRQRGAQVDAVAFFVPHPADASLHADDVIPIYRALRDHVPGRPLVLADPSTGH
ncbi:MAG: hypothetical protein P1V36_01025 [Planctomycetota bacterium]|nr:hypothetical protein [Planctomycetota bacterium]